MNIKYNNKKVLFNTNLTFDSNLYNDFTFSPFLLLLRIYIANVIGNGMA